MLEGIYAISDTQLTPYSTLKDALKKAILGGISLFQLRDKETKDSMLIPHCKELMQICKDFKIPFILNDRIDLAIHLETCGLHIGKKEDDSPYSFEELQHIRSQFKGILGVSCYGDCNLAQLAIRAGADYIAFGSCFSSPTKPSAKTITLDLFKKPLGIPKCAIGGINASNIAQLHNAQMVACISSIWKGDIAQNVKTLKQIWHNSKN